MNNKYTHRLKMLIVLTLLFISSSNSGATTYSVNRSIGAGSVTGTITTDGSLGILSASNFLNWELLLNDSKATFTLYGPESNRSNSNLFLVGNAFSATASELIFDFSGSGLALALFQNPSTGSGMNWWCLEGTSCSDNLGGETLNINGPIQFSPYSGQKIIATTFPAPVPAAVWLFGSALIGLIGMRKQS
ncbi:MAG: hypothetical protein KGZ88_20730 [Methylomicrobium sp.]|nr:hypothetical protein [Methylomicrobium sp.]